MKKKIYAVLLSVSLVCALSGCGKKESANEVKDDLVSFVNDSLPEISAGRDTAISIYNNYFTGDDIDLDTFLSELNSTAIPAMEICVDSLGAVETKTDEVAELKDLYTQSVQKEYDAMKMVASAIEEENQEFLTQADQMINDAADLMTQYEDKLVTLADDNGVTVNGSFE